MGYLLSFFSYIYLLKSSFPRGGIIAKPRWANTGMDLDGFGWRLSASFVSFLLFQCLAILYQAGGIVA